MICENETCKSGTRSYNLPPNKPTSINYKEWSTLLATHRYQYEVLRQRLNTRDELGFEMRGVGEDVDEDWSSHDERIVGDDDGDDFPLPGGSFPGRTALPEP